MDPLSMMISFVKSRMGGNGAQGMEGQQGGLLDVPQSAVTPPGPQMQQPAQAQMPQQYRMPGLGAMLPQGMQDVYGGIQGFVPAMQDRMMGQLPQGQQDFFRMLQQKRDAHGLGRPQRQQEINAFNNMTRRY
jgi:hypothetical protein